MKDDKIIALLEEIRDIQKGNIIRQKEFAIQQASNFKKSLFLLIIAMVVLYGISLL